MTTITFKEATEQKDSFLQFVDTVDHNIKLEEDEYFALMVVDNDYPRNKSPYVMGIEPYSHVGLVGVERTDNRPYISKKFGNRHSRYRGITIIVKVQPKDLDKCCLLTY